MLVSKAFNVRRLGFVQPSGELVLPSRHVGIEIEVENVSQSVPRQGVWNGWDIHRDNSLRNAGLEFVTPATYGEDVVRLVHDFCREAQAAGFRGSVRTGTHIHVNMSGNDVETLQYIVATYSVFEPALFRMVGEWRRWSNFCYSLNDAEGVVTPLRTLFSAKTERALRQTATELERVRYTALNLAPLAKYGTIEFRMFPTSFNPDEILLWVNLVLSIVKYGEHLASSKTPILSVLESSGIHALVQQVFGDSAACLAAMRAFVKDRDAVTCRAFLLGCNEVTATLLSGGAVFEDEPKDQAPPAGTRAEIREFITDPFMYLSASNPSPVRKNKIDLSLNPSLALFASKHKSKKKPRNPSPTKQKPAPTPTIANGEVATFTSTQTTWSTS